MRSCNTGRHARGPRIHAADWRTRALLIIHNRSASIPTGMPSRCGLKASDKGPGETIDSDYVSRSHRNRFQRLASSLRPEQPWPGHRRSARSAGTDRRAQRKPDGDWKTDGTVLGARFSARSAIGSAVRRPRGAGPQQPDPPRRGGCVARHPRAERHVASGLRHISSRDEGR